VQQMNIWDPSGLNFDPCIHDARVLFLDVECSYTRSITLTGNCSVASAFTNIATNPNGVIICDGVTPPASFSGGIFQGTAAVVSLGVGFAKDCILAVAGAKMYGPLMQSVCLDTGCVLNCAGNTVQSAGPVYGVHGALGTINVQGGGEWQFPGSAVTNLQAALTIGGLTNAYSNATAAGVTTTHALALSPTNLDAAAGAAGFGGLAYVPGVGGFYGGAAIP
jgi:hypothetical protein